MFSAPFSLSRVHCIIWLKKVVSKISGIKHIRIQTFVFLQDVLSIGAYGSSSTPSKSSSSSSTDVSTPPYLDDDGNIWMEVDPFKGDEDIRKEVERAAMQRMRLRQFDSYYFTGAGKFQVGIRNAIHGPIQNL